MKLKEIPNLIINKKYWVGKITDKQSTTMKYREAFNAALSLMSEREISLNVDKLSHKIKKYSDYWYSLMGKQKPLDKTIPPLNIYLANSIKEDLGTILECKNE